MSAARPELHVPVTELPEVCVLCEQRPALDDGEQEIYRVFLCRSLSATSAAEWNSLLDSDDAPLLSFEYLEGLEVAGCVGGHTSWQPLYIMVRRLPAAAKRTAPSPLGAQKDASPLAREGELVAAAPTYVKYDSDGEWVYDFDWAEFAASQGMDYYPKLAITVPFNPVGGSRLLCRADLPATVQERLRHLILHSAKRICQVCQLSSAHVLFPRPSAAALQSMLQAGFLPRQQEQYHFLNVAGQDGARPYRSFEDFLGHMRAHRRSSIRRERRELREAGIVVRTFRGLLPRDGNADPRTPHFTEADLDAVFALYVGTSLRYTGDAPYLNQRFFRLCAERLGDRLELVLAHDRDGVLIGGAWNLRGDRRLYGRYWGQHQEQTPGQKSIPFLHFEVCYYHSIERVIDAGLDAFEPGHGGEHKLARGFTPVLTYSAHYLRHAFMRRTIGAFLRFEAPHVLQSLRAAQERCPLRPVSAKSSPASPQEASPQEASPQEALTDDPPVDSKGSSTGE